MSQVKRLVKAFVRAAVCGCALSCRRTTPLVSIPHCLFGSTSEPYAALYNKPLTLLWCLVPWILTSLSNDFVNEFIIENWVSPLSTFVIHISAPIPEFSAPFSLTTVTHTIITIYTKQSTMNLGRVLYFCMKKMNCSSHVTTRGSGVNSVHV
jgi:hypothetical protein